MKTSENNEFTEEDALAFFARHLDELTWKYHRYPEKPVLYSGYSGECVQWDFSLCARKIGPALFLLGVNSSIPNKARPERRTACAELLTRINFELSVGCFELDLGDGEIRFRTSAVIPAADITPGIAEHLIRSNLCIVDERFQQIMAVLYSAASPEEALKPTEEKPKTQSEPRFEVN